MKSASGRVARTLLGVGIALGLIVLPAMAQVPTQIPFQGRLLDAGGAPVTEAVDVDFELFDAIGAGTSLWSESHLGVVIVDGVYSVNLGSNVPLAASLFSGGARFLEIRVDGETLVPRQQLLSVPYSLVSERAAVAESVGGTSAIYYEQVFAHFPFDGQEPPNFDPEEGTGDTDGDGIPNFIDPDNDNDGMGDAQEVALGRSINVVNPTISFFSPSILTSYVPTTLVLTGLSLDTVVSASFGAETPIPQIASATSVSLDVDVATAADSEVVTLVIANGQSAVSAPFTVNHLIPTISFVSPLFALTDSPTELTITGTNFVPGTTVQIGSQHLVPSAISATEITVAMAPESVGSESVVSLPLSVTHPNTRSANRTFDVVGLNARFVFLSNAVVNGAFGGVPEADSICQSEATAAGLAGTYRAWISRSTESGSPQSPASSFPQNVGPYLRVDGQVVAEDWTDLTDSTLDVALVLTATGASFSATVWTGTFPDGTGEASAAATCQDWTSTAGNGHIGINQFSSSLWTGTTSVLPCSSTSRFYCFQQ